MEARLSGLSNWMGIMPVVPTSLARRRPSTATTFRLTRTLLAGLLVDRAEVGVDDLKDVDDEEGGKPFSDPSTTLDERRTMMTAAALMGSSSKSKLKYAPNQSDGFKQTTSRETTILCWIFNYYAPEQRAIDHWPGFDDCSTLFGRLCSPPFVDLHTHTHTWTQKPRQIITVFEQSIQITTGPRQSVS